jgi:Stress responsive A/B Barrel Domain
MKKILILLSVVLFFASCSPNPKTEEVQSEPKNIEPQKVLRHVVLFKFTDASTPADVKKVEDAFGALKGKISLIKDYEWGTNSSPENLNQGLTHCFFVTFHSDKDRDDYLVHPDHQAFVEVLKPHLDKVTVIDYWAIK